MTRPQPIHPLRHRISAGFILCTILTGNLPGAAWAVETPGGETTVLSESLVRIVQSDWVDQDLRWAQSRAATSGKALQTFSLDHSRVVLDRTAQLLDRLTPNLACTATESYRTSLAALGARWEQLAQADAPAPRQRRELYLLLRQLARQVAFSNPLLQIDQLLFITRHDSGGVYHMCDQYYGCNARPGGGMYVLCSPFGSSPRLINVLAESVVQNGRLQGQKLDTGTFLSPEVSFDGKTILFAYSEAKGWQKYRGKEAYEWKPEYSFHIFRCGADGSNLTQLTDGDWNDFDPCFLPNGRIAFISERRGGYLRCGRHCPVYTLHSMEPDGGDIIQLSYHETHEWQPSVTNDGMIVYTRWDYVDRDTNIAHHLWTCFPDGRDPRSFHGNYPQRRESRPWMEMNIRAIPNSSKFVASTGAHHGHEFGSLVMIDPHQHDDNALSQITRLTPDVPFPEAEGGKESIARHQAFGTPWPLSEDDYLCVYDPDCKRRGLYWIDRFGNRELIYRAEEIGCLSPMPLQARRTPPLIPDQTTQTAVARARHGATGPSIQDALPLDVRRSLPTVAECLSRNQAVRHLSPEDRQATVAVMNIYDSDFAWPEGIRVDALRIIQVLPKTTAPPNEPRIGIAQQTNARAVLGTVPVEEDGSIFFTAPTGKELYFQALDNRGLAIQSMRSGTYLHPGEQLTCRGCHEYKPNAVLPPDGLPAAPARAPSPIRPDVEGSNPFNFVRLVQPVLDRHCVACHREKKALDLAGIVEGKYGWTRSYTNLAPDYGFYFHVTNGAINMGPHGGARTIPGQFGARASKLMEYLDRRHYGVRLSDEDFHRITLWLDCNSEFYGSYENTAAQGRGEIVLPTLD